ncbi:MAG: ornithine cyclodeaminase family protein [Actinomycetota bacterium]|nr:ornithine cyclodeaminase family protein [Actinomycetota bacterium]
MPLLILSGADVRAVLGYPECAAAMRSALAARARGEVFQPLRTVLAPPGAAGLMALMPAYAGSGYGLKAICITPGNPAAGLDAHQGIVLLSSAVTGEPVAVLNASALTEIRTAAVSAVATDLLAAPGADVAAIIGTGVQAGAHLAALAATRPLAQVRIAGSRPGRAEEFVARLAAAAGRADGQAVVRCPGGEVPVIACASAREAVAGAQIVVTATSSATPVLHRDWLAPGTHINAVGACLPGTRELDTATVAGASLFADSRESVLAEAGDYLLAAADGAIGPEHVRAEIGDLLAGLDGPDDPGGAAGTAAGTAGGGTGRRDAAEITIFESLGLAVEDLAAATAAYQAANRSGAGTRIDFG